MRIENLIMKRTSRWFQNWQEIGNLKGTWKEYKFDEQIVIKTVFPSFSFVHLSRSCCFNCGESFELSESGVRFCLSEY